MLSYSVNQTLRSEERQVLRSPPNLRSINVPVNEVPAAVTVQVHPAEHNVSSGDKALNDEYYTSRYLCLDNLYILDLFFFLTIAAVAVLKKLTKSNQWHKNL